MPYDFGDLSKDITKQSLKAIHENYTYGNMLDNWAVDMSIFQGTVDDWKKRAETGDANTKAAFAAIKNLGYENVFNLLNTQGNDKTITAQELEQFNNLDSERAFLTNMEGQEVSSKKITGVDMRLLIENALREATTIIAAETAASKPVTETPAPVTPDNTGSDDTVSDDTDSDDIAPVNTGSSNSLNSKGVPSDSRVQYNEDGTYTVKVEKWTSSDPKNSNVNDCVSRIVKNSYPDANLTFDQQKQVWKEIQRLNGLNADYVVHPNQTLKIPVLDFDANGKFNGKYLTPEQVKNAKADVKKALTTGKADALIKSKIPSATQISEIKDASGNVIGKTYYDANNTAIATSTYKVAQDDSSAKNTREVITYGDKMFIVSYHEARTDQSSPTNATMVELTKMTGKGSDKKVKTISGLENAVWSSISGSTKIYYDKDGNQVGSSTLSSTSDTNGNVVDKEVIVKNGKTYEITSRYNDAKPNLDPTVTMKEVTGTNSASPAATADNNNTSTGNKAINYSSDTNETGCKDAFLAWYNALPSGTKNLAKYKDFYADYEAIYNSGASKSSTEMAKEYKKLFDEINSYDAALKSYDQLKKDDPNFANWCQAYNYDREVIENSQNDPAYTGESVNMLVQDALKQSKALQSTITSFETSATSFANFNFNNTAASNNRKEIDAINKEIQALKDLIANSGDIYEQNIYGSYTYHSDAYVDQMNALISRMNVLMVDSNKRQ